MVESHLDPGLRIRNEPQFLGQDHVHLAWQLPYP